MHLFQLLTALDPALSPTNCKVHLAGWNGTDDPLDVYLEGKFDDWQAWQSNRNFARPHVVSLIQMSAKSKWLFAGTHDVLGHLVSLVQLLNYGARGKRRASRTAQREGASARRELPLWRSGDRRDTR